MKTVNAFRPDVDRYHFDFGECSAGQGFAQIDTKQDASYYGNWINPTTLSAVTYAEGDIRRIKFDSNEEMLEWVREFAGHDGLGFIGIDPGLGEVLRSECIACGLGEWLH